MSQQVFKNPQDNSTERSVETAKSQYLATKSGTLSEIQSQNEYLKNLKLRAEITELATQQKGKLKIYDEATKKDELVDIVNFIPRESQFESLQKKIIVFLNQVGPEHQVYKDLSNQLNTNDIWEMASSLAEHILTRDSQEKVYNLFRGEVANKDGLAIYKGLIDEDEETKKASLKSLSGVTSNKGRSF